MIQRSWLRLPFVAAFGLSLITNVFLLGFIVESQRRVPADGLLGQGFVAAYPEDVRVKFRQILRENRTRTAVALGDLRQSRQNLAATANTVPLDEQKAERAMQEVRAATNALQALMQSFLLQALRDRNQGTHRT